MTDTDIMEEISRSFIETIAHNAGYFNIHGRDYGTDLHIRKAIRRSENGKGRYLTSGRGVDIQLKAVLEKYVTYTSAHIKYNLEAKNYNDLIERFNEDGAYIPLVLVVFILPDTRNDWINLTSQELIIKKRAYWFAVDSTWSKTGNTATVTIQIPTTNLVDANLFPSLFTQFA